MKKYKKKLPGSKKLMFIFLVDTVIFTCCFYNCPYPTSQPLPLHVIAWLDTHM